MSRLLDTCILVDYLNEVPQAAAHVDAQPTPSISRITWIEIMAGSKTEDEADLLAFLGRFEIVELTAEISDDAFRIRRDGVPAGGRKPRVPDAIILATARTAGLQLLTRNTRDFPEGTPGIVIPYALDPPAWNRPPRKIDLT